jgi:hypothetical protein
MFDRGESSLECLIRGDSHLESLIEETAALNV